MKGECKVHASRLSMEKLLSTNTNAYEAIIGVELLSHDTPKHELKDGVVLTVGRNFFYQIGQKDYQAKGKRKVTVTSNVYDSLCGSQNNKGENLIQRKKLSINSTNQRFFAFPLHRFC